MTPSAKFESQTYSLDSGDVIRRHDQEVLRWHTPVAPRSEMLLLSSGHTLRAYTAEQSLGR